MKNIIILGASGGCLDILNLVNEINKVKKRFKILGFLDDKFKTDSKINEYKILGKFSDIKKFKQDIFFTTAIGNHKNYKDTRKVLKNLNISKRRFPTLIHPNISISKYSQIGFGSIVYQNSTIGINVKIGDFVNILPNTVINHDTEIGDYTKLNTMCNLGGSVKIGESCYIGSGVNIREKIIIGKNNLIGMGSIVLKSFKKSNQKIYGFPARLR
jgi:sugar O-acyltransferase (sialic acid O-acetyltransferase NeuD family)